MKYTPKELKGNVNISQTSPVREFLLLLGGLLAVILITYAALGLAVDLVVPHVPHGIERSLEDLFSGNYKSTEKTAAGMRLQRLLDDLAKEFPEEQRRYSVYLVPHPEANALAFPGGTIVVFSELMKEAESENELAFVLAHELGHFANRDHLRALGRRLVLLTISAVILGQDSSVTRFLTNSLLTVEMKFSQEQEEMADLWALDLLNRRYGQVAGATDFLERLAEKEKESRFRYYFATHPHPRDRVEMLKEQIRRRKYSMAERTPLEADFEDSPTSEVVPH